MTFSRAEKGIKHIFIAEIIDIVGSVLSVMLFVALIVMSITMLFVYDSDDVSGEDLLTLGVESVSLFTYSVNLVSYILKITGTAKASADDQNFKVALYSVIISVVITAVGIVWSGNAAVKTITDLLVTLTDFLAIVYIIEGVRSLAKQVGRPDVDRRGGVLYAVLCAFFVLQTCGSIFALICDDIPLFLISTLINFILIILSVTESILFFVYLGKARRMLAIHAKQSADASAERELVPSGSGKNPAG